MGDSFLGDNLRDCVAVNHDGRHLKTGPLHQLPGVKFVNEALDTLRPTCLQDLDDEFAATGHIANKACPHTALLPYLDPGVAGMAPAGRVAAHVGCAPETGDTVGYGSGAVSIPVDLKCGAHEGIHGIVPDSLAEGPVRPEVPVWSHEEDIRPGRHVVLCSHLGTKGMD